MLRAKVLIFMIPLVLPIGQPKATAISQGDELVVVQPPARTYAIPDEGTAFSISIEAE